MKLDVSPGKADCETSPPMRGRGLKLYLFPDRELLRQVAPHAGAWIENLDHPAQSNPTGRRPPCGGVD